MEKQVTDQTYVETVKGLLDKYFAEFPHDAERLSVLREQVKRNEAELCDRKTLPGHMTGSAIVWSSATKSMMLILHNSLKRWLQPGGHLDVCEDPAVGARRELDEEIGTPPVRLHAWHEETRIPIDIDSHVIPANEKKQELQHLHHDFLYVFEWIGEPASGVRLQQEEVSGHKWVSLDEIATGHYGNRLKRVGERMGASGF